MSLLNTSGTLEFDNDAITLNFDVINTPIATIMINLSGVTIDGADVVFEGRIGETTWVAIFGRYLSKTSKNLTVESTAEKFTDGVYVFSTSGFDAFRLRADDNLAGVVTGIISGSTSTGTLTSVQLPNKATVILYKTLIDEFSASTTYIGKAEIGSATDAAVWQISKVSISGTLTSITYADSNDYFDNVWDDRASLSYG